MPQRSPNPVLLAVALATALGLALSSCAPTDSESSSAPGSPEAIANPADEGSGAAAMGDEAAIAPQASDGSKNAEPAPSGAGKPPSQSGAAQPAPPSASGSSSNPSPGPAQAKSATKPGTETTISIDQTVCGAGGQEAYFETKIQEIYICKNEAEALTYIATPKQKGNSLFLPAQKIQQGELVGYAAIDETKTYIITSGGFQLQDNGKPTKSEKVIRRQLAQN